MENAIWIEIVSIKWLLHETICRKTVHVLRETRKKFYKCFFTNSCYGLTTSCEIVLFHNDFSPRGEQSEQYILAHRL